jgi:transcriptional regulator with XRE-family HTH domain
VVTLRPTSDADDRGDAGELLRRWRRRRGRTQLDLAGATGISTRHVSYIENGRTRPSAEVIGVLADSLEMPRRELNRMLIAAGHAPRPTRRTRTADLSAVRATCRRLLDAAEPYPAVVLDGHWNVITGNRASRLFLDGIPDHLIRPDVNLFRLTLHPDGIAARTLNVGQWARHLLAHLDRLAAASPSATIEALRDEVGGYPNIVEALQEDRAPDDGTELIVPLRYMAGDTELNFITTLTVFAAAVAADADDDISALTIEICFPADPTTEDYLRAR